MPRPSRKGDMKNYYDYVDSLREGKLRPVLERLMPVILMSTWGRVPDDVEVQFPPLWTPTAKEIGDIAHSKAQTIIDAFSAGLMDKATAMQELKKLSDETGLFESISDDEIQQSRGLTYQDVTAMKDPLAGMVDNDPFDVTVSDEFTMDYPGQPREQDGKFSEGKMLTATEKFGKLQSSPQTVTLPDGTMSRLSEGTKIRKIKTFAGKGTKTPYRDAERLTKRYGGEASEWKKVRGDGYADFNGKPRHCELHWSECSKVGRMEMKVKRWFE